MTADMFGILIPGFSHTLDGCTPEEIEHGLTLCYQAFKPGGYMFAAVRLKNGRFLACWQNHALARDTLAELLDGGGETAVLNAHERSLLAAGAALAGVTD